MGRVRRRTSTKQRSIALVGLSPRAFSGGRITESSVGFGTLKRPVSINKFDPPVIDGGQIYVPNYNGGVDVYR